MMKKIQHLHSYKLLTIVLSFLCVFAAFGQSDNLGRIKGTVRDQQGAVVPFIVVQLDSTKSVTDKKGAFVFKNIPRGQYALKIDAMAFQSFSSTITVDKNLIEMTITLSEDLTELEEVTVSGRVKTSEEKVKEQAFAVDSREVSQYKNVTKDVTQVLNQMQGVRVRTSGGLGSTTNLSLNGLSGRQVRFFADGIPVDQLGSALNFNNIPVNLVERVDVYKGVVPVHLGADALGGAINIVTNKYSKSYLDASYSIGSFNTHRATILGNYRFNTGFTVNATGYFNYSDNNYKMQDMPVFIDKKEHLKEIRRFNDQYQSAMATAEVGFTKVKWADELMAGFSIAGIKQEIQSGIYGTPVGEAEEEEENKTFTLKYNKADFLNEKLNIGAFLLFNTVNSTSIDTSSNRYDWSGKVIRTEQNTLGELVRDKTIFNYNQSHFLYRVSAQYHFHKNHSVNLNHISSDISREGNNRLNSGDNEAFESPNTLKKAITGLAYESNFFNDKLNSVLSLKYYGLDIHARNAVKFSDGSFEIEDILTDRDHWGYSFASRYFVRQNLYVKGSFEKGYRMPEPREIFGDGLRILANPFLKPESSFNANIGVNYRFRIGKSVFHTDLNLFHRDVENFIFLQQAGVFSVHTNVLNVLARGIEAELKYTYGNRLGITTNMTWQNLLNNEKYNPGTKTESQVYRDRMPNTPYFFANLIANYSLPQVIKKANFSFYYGVNYVHDFFLNYQNISISETKNKIPFQLLNDLGITYSSEGKRYNVSGEVHNLFDHKAYDNFKLQKPGRSFHLKLRYFFTKQ